MRATNRTSIETNESKIEFCQDRFPKGTLCGFCYLVLVLLSSSFAAGKEPELRWAVLSDSTTRERGFSDFLSVELANSGFSMVEREQVQKLDDEMLGTINLAGISLRKPFELGKRVGANRIILCQYVSDGSNTSKDTPRTLQIVVCDVDIAARIGVFEFSDQRVTELANNVALFLKSLEVQYSSGVELVVGLVPFSCKNLGPDFAGVGQSSYAALAGQILSVPGVGLLEWEAARDLTRELVSSDGIAKRRVPIMIEVDYRVISSDGKGPSTIELAMRIQNGKDSKVSTATVPIRETDQWIRQQILPHLLDLMNSHQRISNSDQLQMLKERASQLFRLGDILHCTQVREVVLQISPNDDAERRRLIDDYGLIKGRDPKTFQPYVFPISYQKMQSRSAGRDHFEFLVRNRRILFNEGIEQFGILVLDSEFQQTLNFRIHESFCKYLLTESELQRAIASMDEDDMFVRSVAHPVLKLERPDGFSEDDELRAKLQWSESVLMPAKMRTWFDAGNEESRAYAAKLIADIVPEEFPTLGVGAWLFRPDTFPKKTIKVKNGTFIVGNWPHDSLVYTSSLSIASHRHLRLYGLIGEFTFRYWEAPDVVWHKDGRTYPDSGPSSLKLLLAKIEQIIEVAKQTTSAEKRGLKRPYHMTFDYALDFGLQYRLEVKQRIAGTPTPPPTSSDADRPKTEPALGRLRFEVTTIKPPTLDALSGTWIGDGPDHDLVFDEKRIYRLDRQGVFKLISPESGYNFFDDEFVWAFQKHTDGGFQLSMFDRNGDSFLTNKKLNLPPCDDFRAFPAGKCKSVVLGLIGESSWCALVEIKNQSAEAHVFHEAREPYSLNSPLVTKRANESIYSQIIPTWHAFGTDATGEILVVGRSGLHPLRIELSSLNVTVLKFQESLSQDSPPGRLDSALKPLIANKKFYSGLHIYVDEYDLATPKYAIGPKRVVGMDRMEQITKGNAGPGNGRGTMFLHDGWLLYPGFTWYRYHLDSKQTERLVPTQLPTPYSYLLGGVSSIHGLLVWSPGSKNEPKKGDMYRVKIVP